MKNTLLIALFFLSLSGFAQDIIVKNDKTEIKAKIEELTETTIKYKKIDMLDGPTYNINVRDVFMIIYKNGTKEYMTPSTPVATPTAAPQVNFPTNTPSTNAPQNTKQQTTQTSNTQLQGYDQSELLVGERNRYYYKSKLVKSYGKIGSIYEKNNATEASDILRQSNTLRYTSMGLSLAAAGLTLANLATGRRGLLWIGVGVACVGIPFSIGANSKFKKSVASYNEFIKTGQRISLRPTVNFSLANGGTGQVGIVLGF